MKNLFVLLLFLIISSCDYDNNTVKFDNYDSATNAKFFEKGWIPALLVNKQMTNILVKTNLDTNEFFFKYSIPDDEIRKLETILVRTEQENPQYPKELLRSESNLKSFLLMEKNDSINIAIEPRKNIIYGWNYKRNGG